VVEFCSVERLAYSIPTQQQSKDKEKHPKGFPENKNSRPLSRHNRKIFWAVGVPLAIVLAILLMTDFNDYAAARWTDSKARVRSKYDSEFAADRRREMGDKVDAEEAKSYLFGRPYTLEMAALSGSTRLRQSPARYIGVDPGVKSAVLKLTKVYRKGR
jgi:hypothetical protein